MTTGDESRWKELEAESQLLEQRLSRITSNCYFAIGLSLVLVAIGAFVLLHSRITVTNKTLGLVIIVLSVCGIAIHLVLKFAQYRIFKEEKRGLSFQIDLAKDDVDPIERRAEKIVNLSRYQIRQYHDFNLRQNRWIFLIGLACVGAGIVVVFLTFTVVILWAEGIEDKVIISAIGAIGSILSNFVGTIYLVMHRSASNALRDFHSKLVESHRMLVGNLLASRITTQTKREDVLAKLALEIIKEGQRTPS